MTGTQQPRITLPVNDPLVKKNVNIGQVIDLTGSSTGVQTVLSPTARGGVGYIRPTTPSPDQAGGMRGNTVQIVRPVTPGNTVQVIRHATVPVSGGNIIQGSLNIPKVISNTPLSPGIVQIMKLPPGSTIKDLYNVQPAVSATPVQQRSPGATAAPYSIQQKSPGATSAPYNIQQRSPGGFTIQSLPPGHDPSKPLFFKTVDPNTGKAILFRALPSGASKTLNVVQGSNMKSPVKIINISAGAGGSVQGPGLSITSSPTVIGQRSGPSPLVSPSLSGSGTLLATSPPVSSPGSGALMGTSPPTSLQGSGSSMLSPATISVLGNRPTSAQGFSATINGTPTTITLQGSRPSDTVSSPTEASGACVSSSPSQGSGVSLGSSGSSPIMSIGSIAPSHATSLGAALKVPANSTNQASTIIQNVAQQLSSRLPSNTKVFINTLEGPDNLGQNTALVTVPSQGTVTVPPQASGLVVPAQAIGSGGSIESPVQVRMVTSPQQNSNLAKALREPIKITVDASNLHASASSLSETPTTSDEGNASLTPSSANTSAVNESASPGGVLNDSDTRSATEVTESLEASSNTEYADTSANLDPDKCRLNPITGALEPIQDTSQDEDSEDSVDLLPDPSPPSSPTQSSPTNKAHVSPKMMSKLRSVLDSALSTMTPSSSSWIRSKGGNSRVKSHVQTARKTNRKKRNPGKCKVRLTRIRLGKRKTIDLSRCLIPAIRQVGEF